MKAQNGDKSVINIDYIGGIWYNKRGRKNGRFSSKTGVEPSD